MADSVFPGPEVEGDSSPWPSALAQVRQYHQRTKHRFTAYAQGPGQLDWDAQPAPFRYYSGAPQCSLPLAAQSFDRPFAALAEPPLAPVLPDVRSVGALLELSLGVSAWKSWAGSRWALRCNPSSGNLHPVEAYLLARGVPGIPSGLLHYDPLNHGLEIRAESVGEGEESRERGEGGDAYLVVAFTSVQWREAWKYGERAFRYCQLDVGHALACLSYGAALLGWRLQPMPGQELAGLLGVDREKDFPATRYPFTEREEPELLVAIRGPGLIVPTLARLWGDLQKARWHGRASAIDPFPGYRWPWVDRVALATMATSGRAAKEPPADGLSSCGGQEKSQGTVPPPGVPGLSAAHSISSGSSAMSVILQRRSAQRYDPRYRLSRAAFYRMLDALLPRPEHPAACFADVPRVHLVLFVLRVEEMLPGIYFLARDAARSQALRAALQIQRPHGPHAVQEDSSASGGKDGPVAVNDPSCPPHLQLWRMAAVELASLQRTVRALSCHQDIAVTGAFSLAMVAEFDPVIKEDPSAYRDLFREAGMLGQALYLEAEAAGFRGTGIGCFFDDPVHQLLGLLRGERESEKGDAGRGPFPGEGSAVQDWVPVPEAMPWQSLYHFTVGYPVLDARIESSPGYPGRERE